MADRPLMVWTYFERPTTIYGSSTFRNWTGKAAQPTAQQWKQWRTGWFCCFAGKCVSASVLKYKCVRLLRNAWNSRNDENYAMPKKKKCPRRTNSKQPEELKEVRVKRNQFCLCLLMFFCVYVPKKICLELYWFSCLIFWWTENSIDLLG